MAEVYDLRRYIREFIDHPRRRDPLLQVKPNWNQLASSFDVIADTEMAIRTYRSLPDAGNDKGTLYLVTYGLLQALYVQQDAVESLVRALNPNQTPRYAVEEEPEAKEIRSVRNCAIGHPTVQGNVNSRKTPGVQMSYHISQPSMRNGGFTLMTTYADGSHTFTEVSLFDLIEKNRAMVERILQRVKDELEAAEMEHRKQFRSEKLVDIFSATLDYQFEKVYEGVRKLGTGYGDFGKLSLKIIVENVRAFRDALTTRGVLNPSGDLEYYLAEVEYPLGELEAYFEGNGSLKDVRAASIFTHFLQDKMHGLLKLAKEVDEEYSEELEGGS
jgi:hypothetical protein